MTKEKFDLLLSTCNGYSDILDFARKYIIHGTPYVFNEREDEYYDFRDRISKKFNIEYYQVYIVGSGKLGFSYLKGTNFGYDSDIDVAIVSEELYNVYLKHVRNFQYALERSKERLVEEEYKNYIKFLKYMAKGWMRPDLLPAKMEEVDKINYGIYGDGVPHFHCHIIPKKEGGLCWGTAFDMNAEPNVVSESVLQERIVLINNHIKEQLEK